MTERLDDGNDEKLHPVARKAKASEGGGSRSSAKSKRSFEQAMSEVERIVAELEGGQLDLSASLDKYQAGIGTLKECYELLENAERRITLLSGFDADGNAITEAFEQQAMTMEQKQAARSTRRSAPDSATSSAATPKPHPPSGNREMDLFVEPENGEGLF